jgi:hypothetical protein
MGFQNKAGSIILDATLTDVGRRYLSKGKLNISKFSLGDDEIVYTTGNRNFGEFVLSKTAPTLEAPAVPDSAIIHGLIDFSRDDILQLPKFKLNKGLDSTVNPVSGNIYLSVNDETTKKLSNVLDIKKHVLQTDDEISNMLVFESGIESDEIKGTKLNQARFIHNLDLFDMYSFVYVDARLFDGLLSTRPGVNPVKMLRVGKEVSELKPLIKAKEISVPAPSTNYKTFYVVSVENNIYDNPSEDEKQLSEFNGPRSCFVPLNFVVNQKLRSQSNGAADVRYDKFGFKSQNIFGDGNLYDYIDTNIMIEGTATARTEQVRIRIVRFSGT